MNDLLSTAAWLLNVRNLDWTCVEEQLPHRAEARPKAGIPRVE